MNMQDPNMMGGPVSPEEGMVDQGQGGFPPEAQGGGESQFDTGFDAGVEADEDEDPKKFIQQLTGKLSQALNSYNNEVGEDEELSKYVGKMIVKAAVKGLDEKGRKDLIKAINTADEPEDEGEDEYELEMDDESEGGQEMPPQEEEEVPMNECSFTKSELTEMFGSGKKAKNSPFEPKKFN